MAFSQNDNWGTFTGCGYGSACIATFSLADWSNVRFLRDTSNCERAILRYNIRQRCYGSNLGWATASGQIRMSTKSYSACCNSGLKDYWAGKGGQCHNPFNYDTTHYNIDLTIDASTTSIWNDYIWGFTPTTSGADYQYVGGYNYWPTNNEKILPPTGLSVSFPSTLGGTTSASISAWSSNTNIGGTPTSYPNAKYWNWAVDLLDTSGNYLAHKTLNRGETKSASWSRDDNFYTASALLGSSAANNSNYTVEKNKGYKLKVVVNNSFNQQQTQTSSTIYTAPPKPGLTITSCVYNPATKDVQLTFNWSKAKDGGAYTETIKYDLYDAAGNYYKTGEVLATVSGGSAKTGTVTVTGLPSGEQYTVKVTVSTTKGSASRSASTYAPVANAAFLGFDWDDVRRTCTIRAEAPGAANCRIQAGYSANNYNIGNKLTSGEVGTLVVKDLQHGTGQIMYLQAVPEASDGHQYTNEIAKISVPIPNPILGVLTPPCDSGQKQQYIVDFVEKKADCSLTPKWQVGDRIVKRMPCEKGGIIEHLGDIQGLEDIVVTIPSFSANPACPKGGVRWPNKLIVDIEFTLPALPATRPEGQKYQKWGLPVIDGGGASGYGTHRTYSSWVDKAKRRVKVSFQIIPNKEKLNCYKAYNLSGFRAIYNNSFYDELLHLEFYFGQPSSYANRCSMRIRGYRDFADILFTLFDVPIVPA